MNSGWQRLLTAADAPRVRLAFACVIAVAGWALFLAHFTPLFVPADRPLPVPETIDMKLVEIAPPEPARTVSAQPQASAPARDLLQRRIPKPQQVRVTPPAARTEAIDTANRANSANAPQTNALPPRGESPAAPAREEPTAEAPAAGGKTAGRSASDTSPASSSAGTVQARLLSQPLPVLPDDLREDAYRAEAVARFEIHADGSTEFELVRPTPNPRLNQILLEALRKWRFFPALENGRPVDSQRDVRVHFNVS
ncbi:TonB family protein [Trinickia mobilis]|uniref:TonB family protein n=1 Tax=Trinickia mobilis TaxID=2816356 RepID=UPI001A903F76|nr:TonB family protein [Trinickia mobilis]